MALASTNTGRSWVQITGHAFFDRPAVMDAMDRATRLAFVESGRIIRRQARGSMKVAPLGKPSAPGHPPHRHRKTKKHPHGGGLWRSVMYAYDDQAQTLVVGPSVIVGRNIAVIATRHEFGGGAAIRNPRRRRRRIGGAGEIRIGGNRRDRRGRFQQTAGKIAHDTRLGDVPVVYATLRTPAQVARAEQFQAALYGPETLRGNWPRRAFMGPALIATARELPAQYRDKAA